MSVYRMEACRIYAHELILGALKTYDLIEYQNQFVREVNEICLEMGYDCCNDKPKYQRLAQRLQKNIYSISEDEKVRDKLFDYANRVMNIGSVNFFL